MKNKSIFPSLFVFFALIMVTAHLDLLNEKISSLSKEWHLKSTRPAIDIAEEFQFKKTTDTLLSNKFRLKNTLVHSRDYPDISYKDRVLKAARIPIFDSITAVYYDEQLLLKSNSLRQLTASYHKDPEFWDKAGLESFEIDMMKSNEHTLVCHYTFLSHNLEEHRTFEIRVDRQGDTVIEQV